MIKINCDLCGKVDENLSRALIEDVELNICSDCSKFGKVIGPIKKLVSKIILKTPVVIEEKEEKIKLLVEDYANIIKKKRESMSISQKDFARKINEKESLVHKIETGIFEPSLALARKLEKALGIKIIEEYEEKHETLKTKKTEGFTLGDFINVKK